MINDKIMNMNVMNDENMMNTAMAFKLACVFWSGCGGHVDLGPSKDDACDEHNDYHY